MCHITLAVFSVKMRCICAKDSTHGKNVLTTMSLCFLNAHCFDVTKVTKLIQSLNKSPFHWLRFYYDFAKTSVVLSIKICTRKKIFFKKKSIYIIYLFSYIRL